jgi:hypothetical protein
MVAAGKPKGAGFLQIELLHNAILDQHRVAAAARPMPFLLISASRPQPGKSPLPSASMVTFPPYCCVRPRHASRRHR